MIAAKSSSAHELVGPRRLAESTAPKIGGHKTPSMLQRYNIQSESDIREAMQLRETRIVTQQPENRLAILLATKQVQ